LLGAVVVEEEEEEQEEEEEEEEETAASYFHLKRCKKQTSFLRPQFSQLPLLALPCWDGERTIECVIDMAGRLL